MINKFNILYTFTAPCDSATEYRCPEGLCIPYTWLCDDYPYDCANNYDESDEICAGKYHCSCHTFFLGCTQIVPFFSFYRRMNTKLIVLQKMLLFTSNLIINF